MSDIISSITQSSDLELSEMIQAVIRRYAVLHPDWEVFFLSLPRHDRAERRRILNSICELPDE